MSKKNHPNQTPTFQTKQLKSKQTNKLSLTALSFAVFISMPSTADATCSGQSATHTFSGTNGVTSDATNWPNGLPSLNDAIVIPSGTSATVDSSLNVRCVIIEDNAFLEMASDLTIGSDLTIIGSGGLIRSAITPNVTLNFGTAGSGNVSGIDIISTDGRLGSVNNPIRFNASTYGGGILNAGGIYLVADNFTDDSELISNTGVFILSPDTQTQTTYTTAWPTGAIGGFSDGGGAGFDVRGRFIHASEGTWQVGDNLNGGTLVADEIVVTGSGSELFINTDGQLATFGEYVVEQGAEIENNGFAAHDGAGFTARSGGSYINNGLHQGTNGFEILSGASVTNNNTIEVEETIVVDDATLVNNSGAIFTTNNGDISLQNGAVTNGGVLIALSGAALLIGESELVNEGEIEAAGLSIDSEARFDNGAGQFTIKTESDDQFGDFGSTSGLIVSSVGTETLALEIFATSDTNIDMGDFTFSPQLGETITVEAAGDDSTGDIPFTPGLGGAPAQNQFAFGDFIIDGTGTVQLVDLVDNLIGQEEAVFVNNLTIIDGTLDANFLNLYILGTVNIIGTGQIINQPVRASGPHILFLFTWMAMVFRRSKY